MLRAIGRAFNEAFHSLRSNFFQTILSVLGIIIGVGALVTMLSLIDGLEATAKEKISARTSLENMVITSNKYRKLDGIQTKRDTIARLDAATMKALLTELPYKATAQLQVMGSEMMQHPAYDSLLGVRTFAVSLPQMDTSQYQLVEGRDMSPEDDANKNPVAIVNTILARRLIAETDSLDAALNLEIELYDQQLRIIGVVKSEGKQLVAGLPVSLLDSQKDAPFPTMVMALDAVDEVTEAKAFTVDWLKERYAGIEEAFDVASSEFWLEQLEQGFLLFRVVMSLIVGIAVVVGGVGVMNVLLMSISARTAEIGVRKAVGANRQHIITQFLSESIAISLIGSIFGLLLGILASMAVAPLFSYFVPELDFRAVFTLRTIITVGVLAVIVGIVFGTYPARRAAGMDPVVAIRRT